MVFPTIDKKKTGINLRRIMDRHGFSVKDIQKYLGLSSVQSIYHWLNGISMPTVDNLYALSQLFQIPVDDLICGNGRKIYTGNNQSQIRRMFAYYNKINEILVA